MPSRRQPAISVLMPTYEQARFIGRALDSLLAQSWSDWELVVVNDGSRDDTHERVRPYLADKRVIYRRLRANRGLGATLNVALSLAHAPLIAYLPSDDAYFREHLSTLIAALERHPEASLVYSGIRHHYNRVTFGQLDGELLQLVQVAHRRISERWLERAELVTDDLERMYWRRLRGYGPFVGTEQATCEWVDHPDQRHKRIREPEGGVNTYRFYYRVAQPLRFHSTVGNFIDEVGRYAPLRERPCATPAPDGLRIALAGELAYNAERVLALEERGQTLYGLWMPNPYWYNTVGPLPFGHVTDLPREGCRAALRRIQPDVIYALLNWQAVPFAHEVLMANPGMPFIWHFKEGPFICREKGTWDLLIDLYTRADGVIYCSSEMRDWFATVAPGACESKPHLILDGDLPWAGWFSGDRSPLLSAREGGIHTVVPGRPIGVHPEVMQELAERDIHLHFYGDFTHGQWRAWIERAGRLAPRHLHLHANVNQEDWLKEFSQYDAGWLHAFESQNRGDLYNANWDDLNIPARMATLAVAGVPMIQRDNTGSVVATQTVARELDIGVFYSDIPDLQRQLLDTGQMATLRENVWRQRERFMFDSHADRLISFFREVIARTPRQSTARTGGRLGYGSRGGSGSSNGVGGSV